MRKCNCSGSCAPQSADLNRREFLGLVGASAATLLAGPAFASFELSPDDFKRWQRGLTASGRPRLYFSDRHTDARMHLGGIGTGNFEIGADGQLTTWQLFNTLRDGNVPFYFLARAGGKTKLLQTAGGPDWPRIARIEMTGEYPVATLQFVDGDLPVQIELTAFSPFAPLEVQFSSMPLATFVFRIHNPTQEKQTVSLAAMMQNPVGYEAQGGNDSILNPLFGGNVNDCLNGKHAHGFAIRAEPASEATLDSPVVIFASANLKELKTPPQDHPDNLSIRTPGMESFPKEELRDPTHTIFWLEEPGAEISASFLQDACDAVKAGATLLFAGKSMPLLQAYAECTGGQPVASLSPRPDILFEDFENGYEKWKVEGDAFGQAPVHGTLPHQQPVSGFLGHGLVNSFVGGDDATGRMISKPFTIERKFIRLLVGGGSFATTQVRLIVDGNVMRTASGKGEERLRPALWDVSALEGQTAHIEIVDEQKGGWGHINVDHIEFIDFPGDRATLALLEEILPVRFNGIRPAEGNRVELNNLVLLPDATRSTASNGTVLLNRPLGKGKVVIACGTVLDPALAAQIKDRQRAYELLCALVGAKYVPAGDGQNRRAPGFGTLALAVLEGEASVLPAFEDWNDAWGKFSGQGCFESPHHAKANPPTSPGRTVNGAVASQVTIRPGETVEVPFLFAWHYPNKYNADGVWMGCHYAAQWPDASAVVHEASKNFADIRRRTELFRTALYDSTLPYWLLDCVTANAAIMRHIGVVFRIANGDIYGWEGSNGCCDPTCTHVWGYEQSLAHLFPQLERDMRRIDFKHQQRADGGVNNRTAVPSPPHPTGEHPFADGHASCILKAYREALNSSDENFVQDYWPHVKRAVEYLIDRDAKSNAGQPRGILQDDQWNTYDEALHGVNTFISGYYLAALRAGEEWARRMEDTATAERFHSIFESGRKQLVELCWNGEYFQQNLADYMTRGGEFGPGCMSDQLIGQWWAHQLGLGYILPRDMVVSALRSIFKYNWKSDLTGWKHSPRAFAGIRDKGLIVCTWPKGGRPPKVLLYSDEVWTGMEYQVAAHMIYEGLLEEGLSIAKGARDRYDGIPRAPIQRNPWSEIECGGHYARAMSSWSLLLALSGFEMDGPRGHLQFNPRHTPENFKCFFTGPEGWGNFAQKLESGTQKFEVAVKSGTLAVKSIQFQSAQNVKTEKVVASINGKAREMKFAARNGFIEIDFGKKFILKDGDTIEVTAI